MADTRSKGKHTRTRRTSNVVRIVATGLVLGLLIVGVGALTNRQGATLPTPVTGPVSTTPTVPASATPTTVPSMLPTGTPSSPTTATTDATDPGSSATLTVDAWSKPVSSVASLLPKSVAGYTTGLVERSKTSAIVPLVPKDAGPAAGRARIVVLTVFDKKTVTEARAYVDQFQRAYPKDLSPVRIGTLSGRFGTDGSHLAAVTFSRGRYAFEIVLTATRGAPSDVKALTLQVAEAFGATKTTP